MPLAAWVYQRHLNLLAGTLSLVGVVVLASTQAHNFYKPTGLGGSGPAIWSMSRIDAETLLEPSLAQISQAVDRTVPASDTIGTDIPSGDITYPLYGPTLARKLIPLPAHDPLSTAERRHLRWVVLSSNVTRRPRIQLAHVIAPRRLGARCACWRSALHSPAERRGRGASGDPDSSMSFPPFPPQGLLNDLSTGSRSTGHGGAWGQANRGREVSLERQR